MADQKRAPLAEALMQYGGDPPLSFHMPGHKYGIGAPPILKAAWGEKIWQYDITEVFGMDNLGAPAGVIREAQELLASLCQVKRAHFLINGATVGLQAAILACCRPGDKIIVPRHAHNSIWSALALSGAEPVWLPLFYHEKYGMPLGVAPAAVAQAVRENPDAKALVCVHPTFHGITNDLKTMVETAAMSGIPTVVDASHGSHFAFTGWPDSAVSSGAAIIVESWHKTMGSLTQSAVLLQNDTSLPVEKYLRLLQSSSPSYLLMASLDATRAMWQEKKDTLAANLFENAANARRRLASIEGLYCLGAGDWPSPVADYDVTRLVLTSRAEHSGQQLAGALRRSGIEPEMSDAHSVILFVTIGDTAQSIDRLAEACKNAAALLENEPPQKNWLPTFWPPPQIALLPREALACDMVQVPLTEAAGKIAAAALMPYPPGIPLVGLGELIDETIVEVIRKNLAEGGKVQGLAALEPAALWVINEEQ